jgi:aspartyl protease
MMIDTGARFSVVTETVLTSLGIAPTGVTDVRTSLQQVVPRPVYLITVTLDFDDEYGNQHAAEVPLSVIASPPAPANLPKDMSFRHDGLLGLDFLKRFRFTYDGPTNLFHLTCDDLPAAARA